MSWFTPDYVDTLMFKHESVMLIERYCQMLQESADWPGLTDNEIRRRVQQLASEGRVEPIIVEYFVKQYQIRLDVK